jgi:hypothetical protein
MGKLQFLNVRLAILNWMKVKKKYVIRISVFALADTFRGICFCEALEDKPFNWLVSDGGLSSLFFLAFGRIMMEKCM